MFCSSDTVGFVKKVLLRRFIKLKLKPTELNKPLCQCCTCSSSVVLFGLETIFKGAEHPIRELQILLFCVLLFTTSILKR